MPHKFPRAIVLTFDNLGEASELERGTWSGRRPLGSHESVTDALPRLLDELAHRGLTTTFFVEAINCELNPTPLREIAARGHELGVHGWRHERWDQLPQERERMLLTRAAEAFAALDLEVTAFRPPGGLTTACTETLLQELGYRWCSPSKEAAGPDHGLGWIPFDWELVDAYHLMDRFAELRVRRGDGAASLAPDAVGERLRAALAAGPTAVAEATAEPVAGASAEPVAGASAEPVAGRAVQTLILHPFLMLDRAWWMQARRTLALISRLAGEGAALAVPGGRLADPACGLHAP
jgi:peptidoglycan/xylan/chitin deacetylase (PgdA/CDA1 family)